MNRRRLVVIALFLSLQTIGPAAADLSQDRAVQVPASCPVTVPVDPAFTPPAPYPSRVPFADRFWYGTAALWTPLRIDGTWRGVPPDRGYRRGYRDKVFWWRPGYDGRAEPTPEFTVTGRRLDAAGEFTVSPATNAYHPDFGGWTMLTGVDIPTTGCWEISGHYGLETLTFVVWVVP